MSEEPFSARHALHAALSRNTGYLVSRVGAFAQKRFAQRMATLGLTTRMWGVLNVLEAEQPITQQALGKAIETDPSSIVATIDQLERDGLVQRRPHPSDRRANALHMTAAGERTLRQGRKLAREAQDELLKPLNEDERQQLHELLFKLAEAAEPL
jgi:MarR family transcriptional regulator, lower aerobic nicotinate degradation pathway regulator